MDLSQWALGELTPLVFWNGLSYFCTTVQCCDVNPNFNYTVSSEKIGLFVGFTSALGVLVRHLICGFFSVLHSHPAFH